jgi:ribonucleoside-diphosphate reductase alpha chain
MGLKAVAIYRDNCKVAQPLSMAKKDGADKKEEVSLESMNDKFSVKGAVRTLLPKVRNSKTFSFTVAGSHGYLTVGEYDDGRPGEVFMRLAKQGSTLAGFMDSLAISLSHGLQYGVPLKDYVKSFTSMSFAPSGITDDPEIRTASSLMDYVAKRLALSYLSFDERLELGLASIDDMPEEQTSLLDAPVAEVKADVAPAPVEAPKAAKVEAPKSIKTDTDAPLCYNCGNQTQKAGSCYVCTSCGSTTGCS